MIYKKCSKNIPEEISYCPTCKIDNKLSKISVEEKVTPDTVINSSKQEVFSFGYLLIAIFSPIPIIFFIFCAGIMSNGFAKNLFILLSIFFTIIFIRSIVFLKYPKLTIKNKK